jgi:uncharacterized protein
MLKWLLVVLIVVVAFYMWRSARERDADRTVNRQAPAPRPGTPQEMVSCAHCGVHLPRHDALALGHDLFCSAEHRSRGPRRGPVD